MQESKVVETEIYHSIWKFCHWFVDCLLYFQPVHSERNLYWFNLKRRCEMLPFQVRSKKKIGSPMKMKWRYHLVLYCLQFFPLAKTHLLEPSPICSKSKIKKLFSSVQPASLVEFRLCPQKSYTINHKHILLYCLLNSSLNQNTDTNLYLDSLHYFEVNWHTDYSFSWLV